MARSQFAERLMGTARPSSSYPREIIIKALALSSLGYSPRRIRRELEESEGVAPNETTIKMWITKANLHEMEVPKDEVIRIQRMIISEARRKAEQLKEQYGAWSVGLAQELFEVADLAGRRLRAFLEKEGPLDKIELDNIRQLTLTVHHMIQDVSLLAGKPTERQEQITSIAEQGDLPRLPLHELAERHEKLAAALREAAKTESTRAEQVA